MSRHCNRCNIEIMDDAIECPLCHGVLEDAPDSDADTPQVEDVSRSLTYPDVSSSVHLLQLIVRIVIFTAIVAEVIVLIVNYMTFNGVYWSFIVGLGLLYGCATLLYSVLERKSMQRIIQVQMLLALLLAILLDVVLGYKGWSFKYVIPLILMGVDLGIVVLMFVGIDGWQTYIMTEIVTFLLSIVLMILHFTHLVSTSYFTIISLAVTGLILLGTIMFGQNMISNEIKRRFRI